ncbi:MAG TPA: ATP-binding protein [Hyphomicrobiaceae bacterium]|nr:ATP-binding protein [Hyphomicrobiaceae bacterium]
MTALTRLLGSTPFRLTVAYLGAFVVAAGIVIAYLAWQTNELLASKAVDALNAEVASLRAEFRTGGSSRLVATINERVGAPGSGLYLLSDADGTRIAGNLPRPPTPPPKEGEGELFTYTRAAEPGQEHRRLAIGRSFAVPGGLNLIVARDIDDQRQLAASIGRLALWSFGLLSALGVGAGILISRAMLARIEAVTDTSRQIMAGDLSRRIPVSGTGDELDRLAENLNAMLARIEELHAALREVSDNIAHDLKTPLNRLRNRAEAALRSSEPGVYREGLAKTIDEADELIRTFNSLLLIARLEAGPAAESMAPVDLAGVIGDIAELYEPAAEDAGLRLAVSVQPGLIAVVNRELVSQAVANLVDNAIKYSAAATALVAAGAAPRPSGGEPPEISICLARAGNDIEIAVGDRGPGIAAEDRERALKRFVRLEKSRSRPGAGLGLSLVAAVARMHGGRVRLEDNAPGLRAVLTVPVRRPNGDVSTILSSQTSNI